MLDRERLSAITDNVVYDEPMSKHTTFRIGGTADAVSYTHLTLPTNSLV